MVGELLDAELRQTHPLRRLDAFVGRHIGEVDRRLAAARVVLGQHVTERTGRATRRDAAFHGMTGLGCFHLHITVPSSRAART